MAHKRLDLGGQGCSSIRHRDRSDFEVQEPRPRQGSNSKEKHRESKGMHMKVRKCIGKVRECIGKIRKCIGKVRECIGKVRKNIGKGGHGWPTSGWS